MLGQTAPDFTMLDQDGVPVTLSSEVRANPVVLIFYVLDHTLG
jgi:peroxiredoxin